ncbi:MAG: hypothetical protein OSJ27_04600 [Candidatus Gastranaerophilales bacterium]|nr:hypothetical protein [Candidatus Gastranaerophilales bacterium]
MRIGLQPAIYRNTKNIQPQKYNFSKIKELKKSDTFDAQPAFTGNASVKSKLIPLIAAAGASLLILTGCGQQKPSMSTMGGTGYKPDPPSYRTEEQAPTSGDGRADKLSPENAPGATVSDSNNIPSENRQTEARVIITPSGSRDSVKTPQTDTPAQSGEDEGDIRLQELEVRYHELKSLESRLGQINNDLTAAQSELKIKQAQLEKAEEKILSYDRKDPNDKPPGFEADYNVYVDISLDVKRLEVLILSLEAEKASAEEKQDELVATVSELGGHPHLD